MADLDHLDEAALREEEQDEADDKEKEEEEDNSADDNDEDPRALPQQQQQEDDWDDSDREEIDVPDAVTTKTTTTTKKQFDDNDEDDDRETIGLDELFASSSKSHTTTTANAQSQLLQELHYTRLYQAWAQESRSPELLPPLDPVTLEALRQAITDVDPDDDQQQQQHQECDNPHMNALIQSIRHIDIQRVKFLLADLLKLRLQKIQAHPLHMRTRTDRMSEAEVCIYDCGSTVYSDSNNNVSCFCFSHHTHSTHFFNGNNNTRTVG